MVYKYNNYCMQKHSQLHKKQYKCAKKCLENDK